MRMNGNENQNESLDRLSEQALEIARRRQAAASDVTAMLEEQFEIAFESHAATVLHAGAWLAGRSLRKSLESEADPPQAGIVPELADDEMKLMKVFKFLVEKNGVQLKPEDYAAEIPGDHKPRMTMAQVEDKFGDRYDEIMQKHEFDYADGARTGAVACARLLKIHCLNRKDLEPNVAASIVSMGFVEGARKSGTS
jgi:hypothetical protein